MGLTQPLGCEIKDSFLKKKKKKLFIWQRRVLAVAHGIFELHLACGIFS